ncbi:NAD/NADH kinase [Schizosaccharomyces cryophilus OY26]|uniref:NAD/NADH kinase n=1 Tax=Schizosaccharomyces cryophilus (strain OY26 / ATCC MYA-4695 / CBS 11777 / NBRC 106824 / NRRL Y48691) TaxID=653667 RepID=S9VP70_SCHCR|nr:NAD/NADH kinase [Schizosaccharomyces cryophilus OY26]EPY49783.1 NAD/NADH kinase [Schizosaccharomyces cryophilus OY26]
MSEFSDIRGDRALEELNKIKMKNLHFRQRSNEGLQSPANFDLSGLNTPVDEFSSGNTQSLDITDFRSFTQQINNEDCYSRIENVMRLKSMYSEAINGIFSGDPKNIIIVTKPRNHSLVYFTADITKYLLSSTSPDSKVYVDKRLANSKRFSASDILHDLELHEDRIGYWTPFICLVKPTKFDMVITIGDNTTVLYTSWLFQKHCPPVLTFSDSDIPGFLTHFPVTEYKEHIHHMLSSSVSLRFSSRLECSYHKYDSETKQYSHISTSYVLNEVQVSRGEHPYISNLNLYNNSELMTIVQADGLIVSTPTGSTNMSMNAGGSLVHPNLNAILITPICPHCLSFRPVILPDYSVINIEVPLDSRATAFFSVDGHSKTEITPGDYLSIVTSQYPFTTIQNPHKQWTKVLEDKLRWNVRERQKPFSRKQSTVFSKDMHDDKFDITENSYNRESTENL